MRIFPRLPVIGVRHKPAASPWSGIDTNELVERHRRDWFRILADLQAAGFSNADVARALKLRDTTIRNWKYGIEPLHSKGEALLDLHARIARRRRRKKASEETKLRAKQEMKPGMKTRTKPRTESRTEPQAAAK